MQSALKAVLAIVLAAVGLQLVAEKLDFSRAAAQPLDTDAAAGGNLSGF